MRKVLESGQRSICLADIVAASSKSFRMKRQGSMQNARVEWPDLSLFQNQLQGSNQMVRPVKPAQDELEQIQQTAVPEFQKAMTRFAFEIVNSSLDITKRNRAEAKFSDMLIDIMTFADIFGRKRMFMEVNRANQRPQPQREFISFSESERNVFVQGFQIGIDFGRPKFFEAILDIFKRFPKMATDDSGNPLPPGEAFRKVQEIYQQDQNAFVLARSTSAKLTKRVQKEILKQIALGKSGDDAAEVIAEMGDFTRSYAETVFRTNVSRAYNAGRMRQAADPEIQEVIGAFEFETADDDDVRFTHEDADKFLAPLSDADWDRVSPPLSYNCRCSLRMVDKFELERRGLLQNGVVIRVEPRNLQNAINNVTPGFGTRPDGSIYGNIGRSL